ncbi:MAG: PadR family transcriptional regulator [Erysipelotrichaceae bacterium]|nr:PadR family transcriptional regulator [Erysipelotrichaceae bacterium]
MAKKNIYFKFDMLILSVLLEKDCYGYEITSTIKKMSDNVIDLKEGSLYPCLYKMLENNYITSHDEIVNRKIRVYYHIEESGKEYLKQMIEEYDLWDKKIRKIIDRGEDNHE